MTSNDDDAATAAVTGGRSVGGRSCCCFAASPTRGGREEGGSRWKNAGSLTKLTAMRSYCRPRKYKALSTSRQSVSSAASYVARVKMRNGGMMVLRSHSTASWLMWVGTVLPLA